MQGMTEMTIPACSMPQSVPPRIVSPERKYAMSTLLRTSLCSSGLRLSKGDAEKLKACAARKNATAPAAKPPRPQR